MTHTYDGVDLNEIWELVVAGFEEWNARRSQISDLLSFRATVPGEAVPQGISSPSMEKLTEYGVPNAANVPSSALVLGYDFGDYGLRSSFTWQALRRMTAEQVYAHVTGIMHSDNRLVTGSILRRLFDPTPRANNEGFQCRGLYAADGQIPPAYLGIEFDGSTTHYWKSGASQIDSGDLDDAIKMVRGKGFGLGDGSQLLILANPLESEHIQTFRQGEESRDGGPVAARSFIPSKTAPAYLQPDNIIGEPVSGDFYGLKVLVSYGPAWLIESAFIPAGYVAVVGFRWTERSQQRRRCARTPHRVVSRTSRRTRQHRLPDHRFELHPVVRRRRAPTRRGGRNSDRHRHQLREADRRSDPDLARWACIRPTCRKTFSTRWPMASAAVATGKVHPSTDRDGPVTAQTWHRWSTVATVTASSAIRPILGRTSASTAAPDHREQR